ncbi:protein of unknown function [Magnetospirillum sp. XM-1]|uniref:hypothetical protein n=1 Tax=Magnetospirillum sp. XM-1 TaxID=1663591 RepID=UPI00073DD13B|nr:hypothetical protein [Magnetospirillum sp. XM-1]CUW37724.1 protein of unknown function [Magnetospirillum sp. XM-1]
MGCKMIIHSAGGPVGHFSVEISDGETSTIRGFRAASGKSLLAGATLPVAGAVDNDESRVNKVGILKSDEIPLTPEQFDRVKEYFEHNEKNPGKYDLNDRNCVDFANGALSAAGIDKNVGQVMTLEQDKQMSGAALYRNAKYPEPNRPLTFPEDGMYPGGTDPHAGVDKRSDATDSVGGLANEAAETEKVMEQAGASERTANLDSRIQSMRDLAARPIDQPAQSALLKPVDTWTESEMKDVLNSAQGDFAGTNAGDPLKAHLYEKVQDWHTTNYGEGEQQYEGGKPVEPLPIRAIPEEPAPHLAKDGGDLWQASARMGDKLTGIAQTDGYEPSVKALQDGLNMLNDANPPAERSPVWGDYTPQDRLKVDGDYGPKTDFALKSALAGHGEDKVDGALSLGRFKGFAEEAKGGDASGLGGMTTSLFGDDSGEALQRTLNRVGPDAVENWQPLEEDNQIGPKTTNAFTSVMDSFDPGEFTQGFGEELGLL